MILMEKLLLGSSVGSIVETVCYVGVSVWSFLVGGFFFSCIRHLLYHFCISFYWLLPCMWVLGFCYNLHNLLYLGSSAWFGKHFIVWNLCLNIFGKWFLLYDWEIYVGTSINNFCKLVHLFDVVGTSVRPFFVSGLLGFDLKNPFYFVVLLFAGWECLFA